jgi:hypothetical protein
VPSAVPSSPTIFYNRRGGRSQYVRINNRWIKRICRLASNAAHHSSRGHRSASVQSVAGGSLPTAATGSATLSRLIVRAAERPSSGRSRASARRSTARSSARRQVEAGSIASAGTYSTGLCALGVSVEQTIERGVNRVRRGEIRNVGLSPTPAARRLRGPRPCSRRARSARSCRRAT